MSNPSFSTVHCVAVPVTDQDRSRALFEDFGFTTTVDAELQPGFRWLEVAPADGGASIAFVRAGDDLPAGVDTGIRLLTRDVRGVHAALAERALDVGELLDWETAPLMFSFCDPDGNRFYVSQRE